eukprot:9530699-Lingulodinium_polyedra.AAC.1
MPRFDRFGVSQARERVPPICGGRWIPAFIRAAQRTAVRSRSPGAAWFPSGGPTGPLRYFSRAPPFLWRLCPAALARCRMDGFVSSCFHFWPSARQVVILEFG